MPFPTIGIFLAPFWTHNVVAAAGELQRLEHRLLCEWMRMEDQFHQLAFGNNP
jgi:hypothetical protein